MRKFCSVMIAGAALAVAAGSAQSQGLHVVRPLSGYVCMALNLTEQQMMDPTLRVLILDKPEASGRPIGDAIATVIASLSPPVNGYRRVLRLDGMPGWISTSLLKPWKNPGGNGQKCIPSMMSNGGLGFDYK